MIMHASDAEPNGFPVLGLAALGARPGWSEAVAAFRMMWAAQGDVVTTSAAEIQARYIGRRGTMLLDAVLSVRRNYSKHVMKLLWRWEEECRAAGGAPSLRWLADHAGSVDSLGLWAGQRDTICGVTEAILKFAEQRDLDEEEACRAWAEGTAGLELASKVDPYVGSVKGIGPALFAYLRVLCGSDSIKPDVWVLRLMRQNGLTIRDGNAVAGFLVAGCVAYELGIKVVELDQLLWFAAPSRRPKEQR